MGDMKEQRLLIIGGGIAGLSAGCYALRSGYRTTIVEHNLTLGGVCTAWSRDPYLVDGCVHWLTGGPFEVLYHELGILPHVELRTLERWATWRDAHDGIEVPFTRDLDALIAQLADISPPDEPELNRLRRGAADLVSVGLPFDAPELQKWRATLHQFWDMRAALPSLVHYSKPVGTWARERLESERLRRLFCGILPENATTLVLLMVLGYLERGWLSRPVGGTAALRDALEREYRGLGGEVLLHATVDEVLVEGDVAVGLRLADGTMLRGDLVLSTASAPETVLRLLGGRYEAEATRERVQHWKLFDPIVLASFGVEKSFADAPSLLAIGGLAPFEVGGSTTDHFEVRVCNDDPCFAPPGHTVVQAIVNTDYNWWASRGARYGAEKDATALALLAQLEPHFPGLRKAVRMTDVATPLTYWSMARSWRGAYEGWLPSAGGFLNHPKKTLAGLNGFYMAGQWVEPGGGVPIAMLSGRQAVQLMCERDQRPFCRAQ